MKIMNNLALSRFRDNFHSNSSTKSLGAGMQAKANIQRGFAAWMVAAITLVLTVLPLGSLSEQITPSAEAQTGTTSPSATPQDKGLSLIHI